MDVKPENVAFILALQERLRSDPDNYDQTRFSPMHPNCETGCCLAGHGYLLLHPERKLQNLGAVKPTKMVQETAAAMGLNPYGAIADRLFNRVGDEWPEPYRLDFRLDFNRMGAEWPEPYRLDFFTPLSPKERVERVCALLDVIAAGTDPFGHGDDDVPDEE